MQEPIIASGAPAIPEPTPKFNRFLEAAPHWVVYALALLMPLFYLPFTIDGLELPKQTLLIALTLLGVVAWLGRMLIIRRAEFRAPTVSLLLGIFLIIYGFSAWLAKSRYLGLVGDYGQEKSGFVTVACFALIFLLVINTFRGLKEAQRVLFLTLIAGFLAVVQALLQALGLRFLPGVAAGDSNLIGTANALGIYVAVILVMALGAFLMPTAGRWGFVRRCCLGLLALFSVFYVAVLNYWAIWAVVIVGSVALVAYGMVKADRLRRLTMLALPMAAIVLGVVFSFVRFPISLGSPAEVTPSLRAGWEIASQTLVASPLLGSGPGTFRYDYAQYRSPSLNSTNFWNVVFDRSPSRLLTMLATVGILGFATFAVLFIFIGLAAAWRLARSHEEWWLTGLTVFAAWLALLASKVVYSSNLTLEFMFWLISALLAALLWPKVREYRFESSPRIRLTLTFLFVLAAILAVAGLYLVGQRYAAEAAYAKGITRTPNRVEDVDKSITDVLGATQLNPQNDLYYRALSQTAALRANLEAQKFNDKNKPTATDLQKIMGLYADAINSGVEATRLAPSEVQNWSSLASIYYKFYQVTGTQGSDTAAIQAYLKASALDPNNPEHLTGLGQIYLALADAARPNLQSKDEALKTAAKKTVDENLAKAKEVFEKALAAKADYSPAGYWLALTLSELGQTKDAVAKLEAVLVQNPSDLNIGFQLGILYYQSGEKDKAIALLERVTEIQPSYANAQWYLAAMYEETGRTADAIARIQEVLKNNPDNENVKQRLAELEAKKSGTATPGGLPAPVEPTAKKK